MPKTGKDKRYTQKTIAFMTWLRGAMASKKVTQVELANELGISQQALSSHMRNHIGFDYPQLVGIFNYLDVPEEQIAKLLKTER